MFDIGSWQHELLIGTEYEDYRKKERVTAIAGDYPIDIYKPVYGHPKPTAHAPAPTSSNKPKATH